MPASTIFQNYAAGQGQADERKRQELLRQQAFMQLDDQRKGAMFKDARVVNSLLKGGNAQGGVDFLRSRADLIQNQFGGDPTDTLEVLNMIESGDINGAASLLDAVEMAGVQSGYLQDNRPKQPTEMEKINLEKAQIELDNLRSGKKPKETQTADEKNFDRLQELRASGDEDAVNTFEKLLNLQKTPTISSKAEKAIIDSQDAYFKAGESARKMELLAEDIGRIDIGGGLQSTFSETLKEMLGSQDEVTALRKEFNGIRASQAVSNLPPGAASDKDIALALSGFPGESANAQQITSFLRGQAKLARIDEAYNEFKAEYIAENNSPKGLISGWKSKISNKDFLNGLIGSKDPLKAKKTNETDEFSGFKVVR